MTTDMQRDDLGSINEKSNVLAAGTKEMPADWRETLHRHDYHEIQFLSVGPSTYFLDFEHYPLEGNTIVMVAPGQLHTWLGDYEVFEVDVIAFRPKTQPHTIQDLVTRLPFEQGQGFPIIPVPQTSADLIDLLFKSAKRRFIERGPNWQQIISGYLQTILTEVAHLDTVLNEETHRSVTAANQLTKNFQHLIEESYQERRSILSYANELGVTANHLIESIRETTGQTPKQILQTRLLLEAKRLLVHTDFSVQQIGTHLSFPNSSAFGRWFKHLTTETPNRFRHQYDFQL